MDGFAYGLWNEPANGKAMANAVADLRGRDAQGKTSQMLASERGGQGLNRLSGARDDHELGPFGQFARVPPF